MAALYHSLAVCDYWQRVIRWMTNPLSHKLWTHGAVVKAVYAETASLA